MGNKLKALENLLAEEHFDTVDNEALIWTENRGWSRKKYSWVLTDDTKVIVLNDEVTEYLEDKVKQSLRNI